ncbi:alpha/beta hydrolase [Lentzea sp. NBRC 105346]|uniref:alpha/beta fold hydrolase n=1 Tax=Lentzea sp. NBRC 105346 TaxID=3032205 RepID=UPI0024A01AA0|nr:alpha/beta fold hydrolase [Lentzea sp. NBRC 105346]GLZ30006.1 alpha/beta hydrolase [Lentzea sp. NBRC 105346]
MDLVFVHGHPFDPTMWQPQVEHFKKSNRVIAPTLRGYGQNRTSPDTFADFAHDLAKETEKAIMIGLSMGGQVVMEFHRLYPERVRAMVLVATTAKAEENKAMRRAMAARLRKEGMAPYTRENIDRMVLPQNEEAHAYIEKMMLATGPEGAAKAQEARAERPDYREMLRNTDVPTLIIVGSDDTYTPVPEAANLQQSMRNAGIHVIEKAAHLPNLEQPKEFNAALEDFIAETTAGEPRR